MAKMSKTELRNAYGYREHQVVLYANEQGEIQPDDLIWHEITQVDYTYEDWKPVAIIVCHNSDKMYRLNLENVLVNPDASETDILWLDQEWFDAHRTE